jgi:hypothetical protein
MEGLTATEIPTGKGVYKAIVAVSADICKTGISKTRKNVQQGYQFRGIDDVYNEIAPLISKHGLCILPKVLEREVVERKTAKGGVLFYVTVRVAFDFTCAEDGSSHVVVTYGEAMDSADKATNKAMSAAYKYACMQTFCIPTQGDNDADATTYEVVPEEGLDEKTLASLNLAKGLEELAKAWGEIPVGQRRLYSRVKDDAKERTRRATPPVLSREGRCEGENCEGGG